MRAFVLLLVPFFSWMAGSEPSQKSLPGAEDFPWYDVTTDDLRRLDVAPPDQFDDRPSRWTSSQPSFAWPRWISAVFEALAWLSVIVVILVVAYFLARTFAGKPVSLFQPAKIGDDLADDTIDSVRVESLPFQLKQPLGNLLDEAKRWRQAGDYNQAIVYLYSYLLVELDRHQFIRLARGKTNRQYLREVRLQSILHRVLRTNMIAFEDVFFGEQRLDREHFERCWQTLDDFHSQLEHVAA